MVDGLNGYGQWESQSRKFFMTVPFGISGFSFATTHRSLHIDRRYLKASKTTVVSQWRIATQSTDRWVKFLWSHYKFLHSANWPPIQPSQKGSHARKLVGLFWVYVVEFRKNPPQTQILPKKKQTSIQKNFGDFGDKMTTRILFHTNHSLKAIVPLHPLFRPCVRWTPGIPLGHLAARGRCWKSWKPQPCRTSRRSSKIKGI